jgi:hypothetical protein
MANSVNQTGRAELQWDVCAIQRNQLNIESAYNLTSQLSPTALLPACWSLSFNAAGFAYVHRATFSTDTAIAWTAYFAFGATALAGIAATKLGVSGAASNYNPQAAVAAAPAVSAALIGGYAAAGSITEIIARFPVMLPFQHSLVIVTAAVAANCAASIWWAEYTD